MEPSDAEIAEAFEENQVVMYVQADFHYKCFVQTHCSFNRGSQEERITILKMAITEKGIIAGSHYDPMPISQPQRNPSHTTNIDSTLSNVEEAQDGVYL